MSGYVAITMDVLLWVVASLNLAAGLACLTIPQRVYEWRLRTSGASVTGDPVRFTRWAGVGFLLLGLFLMWVASQIG